MARLTDEERVAVLEAAHGGPDAYRAFKALAEAAHAYARASGCPLGNDVYRWANEQNRRSDNAMREAVHARLHEEDRERRRNGQR
ncbi:hypothetical protein W2_gp050 [Caulobacter phage W2]|uniref:Uncharacterized protein n=1 Tax=Caulobacter phage TMCBR4 TaxID=3028191 RepID=A0AAF0CJX5_9CAUD|nr:hypothetical protein TMCBR4_gp051 [Caulobacter phage TMCBR4]WDS38418.1 hypothetical protein W2_gp050 [Caulobacter phage W2]